MTTPEIAIETTGLRKHYGTVQALQGLDLRVPVGSIYGFLGRNGAGKTTTMKTLLGMIRPSAGAARVLGHRVGDVQGDVAIRRRSAHVGEDRSAWPSMTVEQVLAISRPFFPRWRDDVGQQCLDALKSRAGNGSAASPRARGQRSPSRSRWRGAPTCFCWMSRPRD